MCFMRSDIKTDLRTQFSILIHPSINVAALAYQFDVDSKSGRRRIQASSPPSSSAHTLDPMSMLAFLLLAIALLCHSGHCLRLSLQEHVGDLYPYHGVIKSGDYDKRIAKLDENLDNKNEIFYSIKISVNGKSLAVQLDTGGTDLWIVPPSDFHIGNTSKIATSLQFASGGTVQGNVSFAEVGIDTMRVKSQALVYARHTKHFSPLFKAGMHGIWGLGFEQSSTILHDTRTAFGDKDDRGLTFFGNLFAQNKTLSNFFTVLLGRKDDPDGLVDGAFNIGEFDPRYKNITSQPKLFTTSSQSSGQLAQFPIWAVQMDGMRANGKDFKFNTQNTVINGKFSVVLDTGVTFSILPEAAVDFIYSSIPGAKLDDALWTVPCENFTQLQFTFGGQDFPIHPLDLTRVINVGNKTECQATFRGTSGRGQFIDGIMGVPFIKNTYAAFDFGDKTSQNANTPFVRMVATTTPEDAEKEFRKARPFQISVHRKLLEKSASRSGPKDGDMH